MGFFQELLYLTYCTFNNEQFLQFLHIYEYVKKYMSLPKTCFDSNHGSCLNTTGTKITNFVYVKVLWNS